MDDDELTPEQKFAMQDPAHKVHFDLAHGRDRSEILADLIRFGWTQRAAERVIERAMHDVVRYQLAPEDRPQLIREARRQFVGGCLVSILSIGVSLLTYFFAVAFGGLFLIPVGVAIAGLVIASRGFGRWRAIRRGDLDANVEESPRE